MTSISKTRSDFFPNSRATNNRSKTGRAQGAYGGMDRNPQEKSQDIITRTGKDAKVNIPDRVRDYSRIRKAVDMAPEIDNAAKIADLRARIQSGTYDVDYEAVADKMLMSEF